MTDLEWHPSTPELTAKCASLYAGLQVLSDTPGEASLMLVGCYVKLLCTTLTTCDDENINACLEEFCMTVRTNVDLFRKAQGTVQ